MGTFDENRSLRSDPKFEKDVTNPRWSVPFGTDEGEYTSRVRKSHRPIVRV
jgi:hypothetical protein